MRFINPNLYIAAVAAVLLFLGTQFLFFKARYKKALVIVSIVLLLVASVYPLALYKDILSNVSVYCKLRALPFSEVFVVLGVPFFAISFIWVRKTVLGKWKKMVTGTNILMILFCSLFVMMPFVKPIIRPYSFEFENKWLGGVCIQSTASSSGSACLATLFRLYGENMSEAEISEAAFSSLSGTESWYMARYARSKGYTYEFSHIKNITEATSPSIVGIKLANYAQFITFMKKDGDSYYIGDPVTGTEILTAEEFAESYQLTGLALSIKK